MHNPEIPVQNEHQAQPNNEVYICPVKRNIFVHFDHCFAYFSIFVHIILVISVYKCGKCERTFEKSRELKSHIKSHVIKPTFECYICKIALRSHGRVVAHIRSVHDRYEKCIVCCNQIEEKKMEQHFCGSEAYVACEYCDQTFSSIKQIVNHLKSHGSDVRLRKCQECPQFFGMEILKKYHLSYHEKHPKSFICSICSKGFNVYANMARHKRTNHSRQGCVEQLQIFYDLITVSILLFR